MMKKILFIDDDRILRHTVSDFLSHDEDYEIILAGNGKEGVALARAHLPDMILCDVVMPELDGFDVLQLLQSQSETASIPFIFLTAQSDRSSTRRGMELGADDYIVKPFTPVELESAIAARFAKQAALKTQYEEQMNALRDNILMALPHELRSPLSLIIGYGDLLASDAELLPPAQIRHLSESICRSGRRLHHLIENYLIYAQIELVSTQPERIEHMRRAVWIAPDDIVSKEVDKQVCANGRMAHLILEANHLSVPASEENFSKIVEELVNNAFKFSLAETAVTITTGQIDEQFHLSITNEGRGMTRQQIKNVGGYMQFERKMHEQQGSGMGLIIAKRLVELYGGTLQIKSVPNAKTTVEVLLPSRPLEELNFLQTAAQLQV